MSELWVGLGIGLVIGALVAVVIFDRWYWSDLRVLQASDRKLRADLEAFHQEMRTAIKDRPERA